MNASKNVNVSGIFMVSDEFLFPLIGNDRTVKIISAISRHNKQIINATVYYLSPNHETQKLMRLWWGGASFDKDLGVDLFD